ncbi:MAG: hypothetical protein JWO25_550 [Alphaproteobacteria bacterium]|nr:hypothetical protein [Alphaproteobacteria bacterium]MDB5720910.1 hypothetical protein [Alphaproteobacteria bacterium]
MEPRLVIAYSMIAIMAVSAVILYLVLSRHRRADRRAWRVEEKLRLRRRKDAAREAETER